MSFGFVKSSQDLALLQSALLSPLVGQPCLRAGLSYGGELVIHFGRPVPYSHPKLAGEKKGEWIFGARASGWRLYSPGLPRVIEAGCSDESQLDEEEIDRAVSGLAGLYVMSVRLFPPAPLTPDGVALEIGFDNGAKLTICPNPEPDKGEDTLADWELFAPEHLYIRCGPGRVWSCLPSDQVSQDPRQEGVA